MEGLYIYINLVLLCNDIGGPSLYISTGLPHCNCWRSLWGSSHGKGFRAITSAKIGKTILIVIKGTTIRVKT